MGANARNASGALVEAVGRLADKAIDRVLLTDKRITSAADGKRLLAGEADKEALAGDIQRVAVLAVPVVRRLARGARLTRVPWVMVASSAVSIGIAVHTGVRELQVLASLVAYRLEQATGAPSEPALVKKLAIDLYLDPKRTPHLADDRLRLLRLTRKWVLGGAIGRKSSKRATRALDAAERLDAAALSARWDALRRRRGRVGYRQLRVTKTIRHGYSGLNGRGWDRTGDLPRLKSARNAASKVNRNSHRPAAKGSFHAPYGPPGYSGRHGTARPRTWVSPRRARTRRPRRARASGRPSGLPRISRRHGRELLP